ncbi:amidohydrolase [Flavobacterium supellecticarium]|uniref:Amidohydrolase n=1 Tax=Flavobacterium supellecticarium TaxID=2565924 RepID=A0A4S3ZUD5_9FLAO|nr:amidohydrolase [Flavobacterium supellecticarium]THF49177.1 amidohydrolase [Flavobacterium supellecticarium]
MKSISKYILLLCVCLLSCKKNNEGEAIYFGGSILTMEDALPEAEALVVKNGKIIFVGTKDKASEFVGKSTRQINLEGKTLLPGFIDAHGHITSRAGMEQAIDLSPSPYGTVNSIPDLQDVLKNAINKNKMSSTSPLLGNGYDDAIMTEHRHPTREELDAVSTTNPIIVIHASGHASVVNSAMLKLLNIPEDVKDPDGGHYGRDYKTNRLNGKLEENASFAALIRLTEMLPKPQPSADGISQSLQDFIKAQDEWLSYGQTTICDGRSMGNSVGLLKEAAEKKLLKADIVYFPDFEANRKEWESFLPHYMKYEKRLKFGGFKFSDDGSPQGKTAWLTEPYLIPPEGESSDYKGYPIFTDETLYADLKTIFDRNITVQLHVNGDAAIDQALRIIGRLKDEGVYKPELRATLIHVQNSRPDHIAKIKAIGVIPSYFSSHVYLWGDWHYNSVFGPKRAAFISPAKSAKEAGIIFTIHHDSPVTPPDLLTGVYSAVNRITRSGMVLGPDERIKVIDALKAITINAAYQYQEENEKGSLKEGKLADLVILDQNPLTINPINLRDIRVVETIKEGKTVFKKN